MQVVFSLTSIYLIVFFFIKLNKDIEYIEKVIKYSFIRYFKISQQFHYFSELHQITADVREELAYHQKQIIVYIHFAFWSLHVRAMS